MASGPELAPTAIWATLAHVTSWGPSNSGAMTRIFP